MHPEEHMVGINAPQLAVSSHRNDSYVIYSIRIKVNTAQAEVRCVIQENGSKALYLLDGDKLLCILPWSDCLNIRKKEGASHLTYDSAYIADRSLCAIGSSFAKEYVAIAGIEYSDDGSYAESRVRFAFDFLSGRRIEAPDMRSLMALARRLARAGTTHDKWMMVAMCVYRVPMGVSIDEVATRIRHAADDDFAVERAGAGVYYVLVTANTYHLLLRPGFWPPGYRCFFHIGGLPVRMCLFLNSYQRPVYQ